MQRTPLHLTECNLTLSDRNYLNDSVARAAFIANTVVGVFSQIQFLGIWNTRDAYSEMADSASYLFGGSGILTKTGAPKPAFHVLSFLKRLYTGSAGAEAGCLVTSNTRGHYKILAQHMVGMNTAYYLKEESQVSALEIDQMAASQERRTIHVRLEGLEESGWQIRRYSLSRLNGSILNEWLDMDMEVELRAEELRYLERVSTPHLSIQILRAKKGVLEFDIELEPNEVQYLHITEFN